MRVRLALTLDLERSRRDEPLLEREAQLDSTIERADERRIGFTADPPPYAEPFEDRRR